MDKLLKALLAEVEPIAEGEAKTIVETIKSGMDELGTKSVDDAIAKRREYFRTLVEIKSGLEAVASDDKNVIIDTIGALYEMFTTVVEGMNVEDPDEAHADLYGILNSLIYCVSDIEYAIKYLKEMALLVELTKDEDAQASEKVDDDVEAERLISIGEKVMKTDGGEKYPSVAYLYVPDPNKPSTWKIRIWETPEKEVTIAQLGRATIAISKGFRGKKAKIPSDAVIEVKSKLESLYKKEGVKVEDVPEVLKNEKAKAEDEPKATPEKEVNMADKKTEGVKVEESKVEDKSKVKDSPVADTAQLEVDNKSLQERIVALEAEKVDNKSLQERIAALEAEKTATKRMGVLKEKGLDVIFATKEDKEAELKQLISMTEEQFVAHVALMEKTKAAFAKSATVAGASVGNETEDPKPVLVADTSTELTETLEALSSCWD